MAELVADIKSHGVREPIILLDGAVLDGWHRYQAAIEAGVPVGTVQFDGDDPVGHVISANAHRRHATKLAIAKAVVACRTWAPPGRPPVNGQEEFTRTNQQLADESGVSVRTIRRAKTADGTPEQPPAPRQKPKSRDSGTATEQAAKLRVRELMDERDAAVARADFLRDQLADDPAVQEQTCNAQIEQIRILKGQVAEWQGRYGEANRRRVAVERELQRATVKIGRLEHELAVPRADRGLQ